MMRQLRFPAFRRKTASNEGTWLVRLVRNGGALAAAALFLSIGVEWIGRGSLPDALDWLKANPGIFLLNLLIVLSVVLLLYSVIGSLFLSLAAATTVLSVAALISFFKTKLIGEPFFPWDIVLNKEGMNIAPLVTGKNALLRIIPLALIVAVLVALRFLLKRRYSVSWKSRIALLAASSAMLVSFALQSPWANHWLDRAGVSQIVWNQQENYGANGFMLSFALNVKNSIITKPDGYGQSAIAGIADEISAKRKTEANSVAAASVQKQPAKQPNVIFIMSEAFWDPTLLPNVTYSEDPVPTIHELQKNPTSGYMLSPQFGGGTSNVEFEVLTGYSTSFLPSGSVPYQQYISRPVPSLASYFESLGYRSLAVHSYESWFWNRENVYKWMGFEGFKSKDNFEAPEYKGAFIADSEVSRSIIREVDDTEKPVFIYAVTMQNHGPYDDDRYGDTDISVQGNLTDSAKQILNTYTQGAHDADASLRMLIDHYEHSDEPTFIVFYGDHLPMLGYDYDVYKQGGFISTSHSEDWSLDELKRMHSVPLVTWSNFPVGQDALNTISSSFLGSYVLNALSIEPQGQFAFNAGLYPELPGLLRNLTIDGSLGLAQTVPSTEKSKVDEYRLMQYDMLFGKQYLAGQIDADYLSREALPAYNSMDTSSKALR